jgi:hypothetical protein
MRNKLIIFLITFPLLFTFSSFGQKLINSPYSRFNIGSLEPTGSFRSQAMGGLSTSLRDINSIYFFNPASYTSLDTNSFIFDFGFDYGMNRMPDGEGTYVSDDMNFDHLFMAMPLKKGGGLAFGVVPVSNGYYSMIENVTKTHPDYDPVVGEYSSTHKGDGVLTNLFVGAGFNITKKLSVGVNLTVLFGTLKRTNSNSFSDEEYYNVYSNSSIEELHLGGTNLDYGIQYNLPLKNNYFLIAGASLSSGKNYRSTYDLTNTKFTAFSTTDTITYIHEKGRDTFIPGTLRIGLSVGKKNKFTAGLEYEAAKWSKAKIPGSTGYAADTRSYAFGAEYIPDKFSNYSLLKKIEYRIGAHMGDEYLIVNGEQIKEIGASFGFGIPLSNSLKDPGRSRSRTNIFFDYSRRSGSAANGLHTENFYTVGVSLNFYDFWFVKRKYD